MAITKWNKKTSMGTAVFSAVSLKLCCWGPLLLTSVAGISGSSVYFSWLIALKPYLLAIAFLSLGLAFYQVYKKKRVDDCDNCETDKPSFFKYEKDESSIIFLYPTKVLAIKGSNPI